MDGELLAACRALGDGELLELKARMDAMEAHRQHKALARAAPAPEPAAPRMSAAKVAARRAAERRRAQEAALNSGELSEDELFKLKQKLNLQKIASGRELRGQRVQKPQETEEEKAARLAREVKVAKMKEAMERAAEDGPAAARLTKEEQAAQRLTRKERAGIRQMKNGASKHKFDLEAHNARKASKQKPKKGDAERKKVLCPCGCNKMIDAALYKTGASWHAERNSKQKILAQGLKKRASAGK
jgi:hypothetical protein